MADGKKVYSLEECSKHRSETDCWLIIHGKVYNVTEFLDEHPGGYDIVVAASGKDGTDDFEEIGHSNTAKEMLESYYIGEYEGGDAAPVKTAKEQLIAPKSSSGGSGASLLRAVMPLLVILLAIIVFYLKK
eukprot:jgi/Picsp_1/5337/NSC_02698-R1_cytochrome b5